MEESKRIKVYLNEKPIIVFRGMKLKHILDTELLNDVRAGIKYIVDEYGNKRGLEGNLENNEHFFIKK